VLKFFSKNFPVILALVFLAPVFFIFAQNAQNSDFDAEKQCPALIEDIDKECQNLGIDKCRKALEECEKFYQQKSSDYKNEIKEIQNKQKSLQNQIQLLEKKISNLGSQINTNNIKVKYLTLQIDDTQSSIDSTGLKIQGVRDNLAELLRFQYEEDQKSTVEIILAGDNLSDFFDNLASLEALNDGTKNILKRIKDLKTNLQGQQDKMIDEKDDLEETVLLNTLQKEENQKFQNEKQQLLKDTKGQEALYKKYLEDSDKKAKEIRKKIFELAQVAASQAVTLEQAYVLAKEVEKLTGVRPAFLLGLLQAESAIGKNVGQCNCGGATFCRNPEITWKQVMPERQWPAFEAIVAELGFDISKTSVSCAINGGKVQWGGAMGPAQFMPDTWLTLGYKARVEEITGIKPANPWRIKDAFLAAGLYLADQGAATQKEKDEIGATTAYLCGTKKMTSSCRISGGKSYVYQVMQNASQFQGYVDQGILQN
jgi:peptidoglycan hydrolase CwlO-like protein